MSKHNRERRHLRREEKARKALQEARPKFLRETGQVLSVGMLGGKRPTLFLADGSPAPKLDPT